ncbi:Soluble lytic murein transglycosylase and related regulatory proteins (some containing LysM/invasin domains) [Sporomusa sp. KB1]|nr:Soluble lytic murein transglycosylase and related regulatory proteins (some containing LysM/invasin domains) [Sporomusa sp. KB1]
MMSSVNQVTQRIAAIERRFTPAVPATQSGSDFATTLSVANAQLSTNSPNPTAGSSTQGGDIAKMIQVAAAKYGVDPKLAMAVAEAESGLSQEAVSPVGAVGVMQLMPETASSLGVRNINDPRENIDGGVQYLKQMLNTFDGDVTKAVAAYNAGPQAVKNYNGVPPYSETRNYVAKVLSLAK